MQKQWYLVALVVYLCERISALKDNTGVDSVKAVHSVDCL